MASLPAPVTGDVWGAQLNAFLGVGHNADGTIIPGSLAKLTGAVAATRYVGGTVSGAPVAGTFAVGDFVIDQTGQVYVCIVAGTPGRWTCATKSNDQLLRAALGIITDVGNPLIWGGVQSSPTSQSVYGVLLGLHAGTVVTGVQLRNNAAAAGTLPTTVRFGIADATGNVLAVSGNLNAVANWGTGAINFPLSAPYTVLADGGYYACFVVNGAWGTTQPSLMRYSDSGTNLTAAPGGSLPGFLWAGQTDLPAVASSLTITTPISSIVPYVALY